MWTLILDFLLQLGLGVLGLLFKSVAVAVQNSGLDATAIDYISGLVTSAEGNSVLDTSEKKFQWVYTTSLKYLKENDITIAMSLLNAVIELAVHHQHHPAP